MKRALNFVKSVLGLAAFVAFALVVAWLFGAVSQRKPVVEEPYSAVAATPMSPSPTPTPEPYPPPEVTPTPGPIEWSTPTPWPTPTEPPVPTPLPTPVVTPIPLAKPPFIPGIEDKPTEPYKIILRKGNTLWIMSNDGGDKRMLIDTESEASLFLGHSPYPERPIGWGSPSPDGKRLALVLCDVWKQEYKGQPVHFSIYTFEIETGELEFLVEGVEPVWSPDGKWIAYQGPDLGLWVVDVVTGEAKEIYPVEEEYEAIDFAWSPDGKRIAFLKKETGLGGIPEMLVINADGSGEAVQLISKMGLYFYGPRWSPDGKKIMYVSSTGERFGPHWVDSLWIMNASGSDQKQLTKDITVRGYPWWSPDGKWIVFCGPRYYEDPEPPYDLWLINAENGNLLRLTKDSIDNFDPRWSPNGTQLVFQRGAKGIWTLNLGDGRLQQVYPENADFAIMR